LDIRRFLRPDLDELEEYVPVKPLDVLAAEIGVPVGQLVKLDANENLYGPIPEVVEAVAKADFHIYPDPGSTALREAIADYAGVRPEQIVAGAGADELIDLILRLVQPKAIVDNVPTFGMYSFLAKINGARVVDVARKPGFEVDVAGCEAAVRAGASVVFVTSPNNPSGNLMPAADLERLLASEAIVVLDEAYVEFSGGSHTGMLERFPNLMILRTFSKWAGIAGLRVGYSLSHPDFARLMMAIKQPYNVNVAGDAAARAAIQHRAVIFETVKSLVAERERMSKQLAGLAWLKPLPSQSNFVLVEVKGRAAKDVAAGLRQQGVLVRYYQRPELRNYIRISAGRPEDTDRLLAALRALEAA
jgi:histidinol-phosphate aminotransferase